MERLIPVRRPLNRQQLALQAALRERGWDEIADNLLLGGVHPGIRNAGSRSANFTVDIDAPIIAARQPVIGDSLSGVTDAGTEPVKVGGVFHSTLPTVTDGMRVEAQYSSRGGALMALVDTSGTTKTSTVVTPGDSIGTGSIGNGLTVAAIPELFNGATYDRQRIPAILKNIAAIAITAATPVAVWTPAAGKKFRILLFSLTLTVAGSIIFKDGAGEAFRTPAGGANAILTNGPGFGNGYLSALANNVLSLDVTGSGSVSGYILGTEE